MGLFNFFKKKAAVPQPAQQPLSFAPDPAASHYLLFDLHQDVRDQILALSEPEQPLAQRWHQAFYAIFSQASNFIPEAPTDDQLSWLADRAQFKSNAGIFIFGIDQYEDGGLGPIQTEAKEWNLSRHIIAEDPQLLCAEIALSIEEAIGTKLDWCLYTTAPWTLSLTPKSNA